MVEAVIEDQYTAARAYFASVIGLLFVESAFRLPSFLLQRFRPQSQLSRNTHHWPTTVLAHKLLSHHISIPYLLDCHVADIIRFVVFAGLNVIFGLNHNESTTDYKLYGWLTIANGGLALLMAPRSNLFAIVLRIPSAVLLRYHRWIGLATVANATTHISYNIKHYIETDQVATSFSNERIRIGITAWICLAIIFLTALPIVRRRSFEVFYYAHFLFFVFMVGALRHTTNGPEFLLPGFGLWVVDRAIRFYFNFRRVDVQSVTHYDGHVTKFKVKGIMTRYPGQIVWAQIPDVSLVNWHPFTVASSPNDKDGFATIAVRGLGGFTKSVQYVDPKLAESSDEAVSTATMPMKQGLKLRLDGPYGVGRLQWTRFPVVVLVAGGIGITPGISIASHIINRAEARVAASSESPTMNNSKAVDIHLLWVVKEAQHIKWFEEELQQLQARSADERVPVNLAISIHVTGASSQSGISDREKTTQSDDAAASPRLVASVSHGRPNLQDWFRSLGQVHAGCDAAVSICGPKTMVKECRNAAGKNSSRTGMFYVEDEVFEL